MEENHCQFLSSRGIAKSCTFSYSPNYYKFNLESLKDNDSIHVHMNYFENFCYHFLPTISKKFYLFTGDSDTSPNNFHHLVKKINENPFLIFWYGQNLTQCLSKMHHLPIGLDYHTLSNNQLWWGPTEAPILQEQRILNIINKNHNRQMKIYSTFHFELNRGDRNEAYSEIPKELIDYEQNKVSRVETWENQSKYFFVASPFGNGLDCHRTWEALIMGCIPIIKSSGLDNLFENLPVLLVNKWSDINIKLLEETVKKFEKYRPFHQNKKLQLKYWVKNNF